MDEKTTAIGVLAIVALIAVCSCALIYRNSTSYAVYEQPANNKPVFLQTSTYLEGFDLCKQFTCKYPGYEFYGESEPASIAGIEELTGNVVCRCGDGRTFQIRPDRIEVATY